MRAIKAKALRRRAEALTVGRRAVWYRRGRHGVELDPACTRAIYQKLKRG